jgi:hypothetical protein
VSIALGKN